MHLPPCIYCPQTYKPPSSANTSNAVASRIWARKIKPDFEARLKMVNNMALYEHTFIARQDLSNAQAEGLIEHFGAVLADNGGKLVDQEYWGLKTLAYKINKNRKGHYGYMKSDAPSDAVKEMERLMRLHDDVMRIMTIKVDAHEEGPSVVIQAKSAKDERRKNR